MCVCVGLGRLKGVSVCEGVRCCKLVGPKILKHVMDVGAFWVVNMVLAPEMHFRCGQTSLGYYKSMYGM